jgi:S-DNA-T family DNA segregation ATPase FtsK/SpoIIIE
MRRDPLVKPVAPFPIPASVTDVDFRAVPVGLDEFGDPYTLSVVGGHTSAAGASGAGKAGLEWNLLRGLAPAIAANWVRPVFIDPKGRELRQARSIVAPEDYVGANPEGVLALLVRLVDEMNAVNERDGADGERDFEPGPRRKLVLILIDELAPLLRYWSRSIRAKIEDALGLLLTQGRAAGFIVIGAVQEPTKDTFTCRDLFARRIALRLPTESHTDASLIEDAVEYGARCHEIPETEGVAEGVFYSLAAGSRTAVRARLGWVKNEHIAELVEFVETARAEAEKVVELDDWRHTTEEEAA